MKLYAILSEVGSEYYTVAPIFVSLNLNLVREKLQKSGPFGNGYLDPSGEECHIAYIDLDPNLIYDTCSFEGDENTSWITYEGIEYENTCKNIKTGEIDPNFVSSGRPGDDDWVDGWLCKKYVDGKLVNEYFELDRS
jgi:hypothetical protein